MERKDLTGKKIAITGATGGLGRQLCKYALKMGAELILIGRNAKKEMALKETLRKTVPSARITCLTADFLCMAQVRQLAKDLQELKPDLLYLNAGNYYMDRIPCSTGFDPVYQINFLAQYSLAKQLMPILSENRGKLVVTGSIAHGMVKTDPQEPDYRNHRSPEVVYGNSKRYLMFACEKLAEKYPDVQFAIAHPGITPTGITSNYPEKIQKLVHYPMKLTFQQPELAARGMMAAMTEPVPKDHWIGPGVCHIWGKPKISELTAQEAEKQQIFETAERLYTMLTENGL